jgi:hypothetical protein
MIVLRFVLNSKFSWMDITIFALDPPYKAQYSFNECVTNWRVQKNCNSASLKLAQPNDCFE